MQLVLLCTAVLALLAGTAGHATPQPGSSGREAPFEREREPASLDPAREEPADPVDPESARTDWRWIGLRRRGVDRCPEVRHWHAEDWLDSALFSPRGRPQYVAYSPQGSLQVTRPTAVRRDLRRMEADLAGLRRLGLDRLCIYSPQVLRPDGRPPAFRPPSGLAGAERGRMAVAPAAAPLGLGELGMTARQILARHLMQQAGKRSGGKELFPVTGPPGVRLVFLDTQQDGEGVPASPGPSAHGFSLAHLAHQLVCREPRRPKLDCAAQIATRLALGHTELGDHPPADPIAAGAGGNLGLVDELAAAIVREVWDWRQSGSKQKLILNLSVGWDGERFEDLDRRRASKLDPSVRAVYSAASRATAARW